MYYDIAYNEALKKLGSTDSETIVEGIKELRESGKPETIKHIVALMEESDNQGVLQECARFLNDIKDPKGADIIVECLRNGQNKKSGYYLVSSAWQNNLDYSGHIDVFVDIFLNAGEPKAFEAYTVIGQNIDKLNSIQAGTVKAQLLNHLEMVDAQRKLLIRELIDNLEQIPT